MSKKKQPEGQVFTRLPDNSTIEIHVLGDMLPCSVYLQILDLMKKYLDQRTIVFMVYQAKMLLLIRESVPSEFYDRIELYSPSVFKTKEGLKSAS